MADGTVAAKIKGGAPAAGNSEHARHTQDLVVNEQHCSPPSPDQAVSAVPFGDVFVPRLHHQLIDASSCVMLWQVTAPGGIRIVNTAGLHFSARDRAHKSAAGSPA